MTLAKDYVLELEQLTLHVVQQIHQISYEELADFSDHREELANLILPLKDSLDDQDRNRLLNLRKYDEMILSRMAQYKEEASDWLLKRGNIKNQTSAYNVGYTPDSMFFDYKK
ncbi:hypothetical protein [Paenibacillus rubinfantis]|jgi:hypothetical protein|uniref:hypothetical protein n=1 Tax=Paenibacillus rubinfantis TaxID=1720296 RepID=UPI00073F89DC|nr:hypothetical protein [Paenibacillus rubinfantis]